MAKMDHRCTMELSKTLFVIALLLSGAASMKSQAYFNETGDLPCHFTNSQNISLDELVVFWQNQDKLVLYELFKGKENPQNVHPKYKGRTSFDQDNWALRLHNVQIKDTGTYQCFIHRKRPQGLVSIHQMSSDLSVLANFSRPEIMIISNRTENSDTINLTCSSIQGYPKPKKMSFVLKTENSTTEYDVVMNIFQNNFTDLYNVSISLSISVSPKRNVSIFCVLQPESTKIQLVSQPYNIEANNMEERESEQGKERVENRASERFDKVQCDVNTSTTASDSVAVMRSKETSSSFREEEKHKHNR
ncbi:T-lymphocyte activation antigen CD86 isoform X5 [Rousettus aegyptiacus]|uniref:T-lymphocyte activation antigen CD86 isoform X5 n=1 Tax=Rousettus aegyptiacus TaxID=9407 RepID=UPI00168D09FF|nr:T-lymphocyte activation antigen CD86 isoform X5 [Rousettus aegyptiacus]